MSEDRQGYLIPPKLCAECRLPFTPRFPTQQFCPKPARCAYQAQSRQRKGQRPEAAIAKRRAMRGQAIAAAMVAQFGELSARELELYGVAYRTGYDSGYCAGIAPLRKVS